MSHSPEPWSSDGSYIYDATRQATFERGIYSHGEGGDFARAVNAVNFCTFMSDEMLEWFNKRQDRKTHIRGIVTQWWEANRAAIELNEKAEGT